MKRSMLLQDVDHLYQQILDGYRNRVTLFIYWGLCSLVLLAAAVYLWWTEWQSAAGTVLIFVLMLAPSVLKGRYRLYLPFALEFALVCFTFLTLFLGGVARFYDTVPFWDKFLHFQSGLLMGAAGFVLVYILNEHERTKLNLSPGFIAFFAITFSIAIGLLWEIVEFAADSIFKTTYWQFDNADTMLDLIADGVGALIMSVAGYFWMYRNKRLPFTPWVLRFFRELKRADLLQK